MGAPTESDFSELAFEDKGRASLSYTDGTATTDAVNPSSGDVRMYFRSDGLYTRFSNGTEMGPHGAVQSKALVQPAADGSAVTLTNTATAYGIAELTTGNITYAGRPLFASATNLGFTQSAGTNTEVTYALAYNKNGGATWYVLASATMQYADPFGFMHPYAMFGVIPNAGTGTLAVGDVIKVRVQVHRTGGVSRTVTQKFIEALGIVPALQVVAY